MHLFSSKSETNGEIAGTKFYQIFMSIELLIKLNNSHNTKLNWQITSVCKKKLKIHTENHIKSKICLRAWLILFSLIFLMWLNIYLLFTKIAR